MESKQAKNRERKKNWKSASNSIGSWFIFYSSFQRFPSQLNHQLFTSRSTLRAPRKCQQFIWGKCNAMQTMTHVMDVGAIFMKCIFLHLFLCCILPGIFDAFQSDSRFGFSFSFWFLFCNNRGNWMSWLRRLSIYLNVSFQRVVKQKFQSCNACMKGRWRYESKTNGLRLNIHSGFYCTCVCACIFRLIQQQLDERQWQNIPFLFRVFFPVLHGIKWFKVYINFTHKCAQSSKRCKNSFKDKAMKFGSPEENSSIRVAGATSA